MLGHTGNDIGRTSDQDRLVEDARVFENACTEEVAALRDRVADPGYGPDAEPTDEDAGYA